MAESDKMSLQKEVEENIDVFSEELEKSLQINDFVWVETNKPKIMQEKDDQNGKKQSDNEIIINSNVATLAPHESFRESSGDMVLSQTKYSNEKTTDGEAVFTSDLDKELLEEQKYWAQHGSAAKRTNSLKLKYPTSQRMTLKEHNIINNAKGTTRHPSSYQFGIETTGILEMFLKKNYVERYQNVAGRGLNSVVIYSPNPSTARMYYSGGIAVKVYELDSDVGKNSTILKKVQREYDNLNTLNYYCLIPRAIHMYKNVIVMQFIGDDQETGPSINTLPLERSKEMYDRMVAQLRLWYKQHIVHGRLSSKCIRFCWDRPYVLGWSRSVRTEHPQALKKLMRDCHFVTKFFKRRSVPVTSAEELFKSITGIEKLSKTLLDEIYGTYKNLWPDHHLTNPNRTSDDLCRPHSTSRFKA